MPNGCSVRSSTLATGTRLALVLVTLTSAAFTACTGRDIPIASTAQALAGPITMGRNGRTLFIMAVLLERECNDAGRVNRRWRRPGGVSHDSGCAQLGRAP